MPRQVSCIILATLCQEVSRIFFILLCGFATLREKVDSPAKPLKRKETREVRNQAKPKPAGSPVMTVTRTRTEIEDKNFGARPISDSKKRVPKCQNWRKKRRMSSSDDGSSGVSCLFPVFKRLVWCQEHNSSHCGHCPASIRHCRLLWIVFATPFLRLFGHREHRGHRAGRKIRRSSRSRLCKSTYLSALCALRGKNPRGKRLTFRNPLTI